MVSHYLAEIFICVKDERDSCLVGLNHQTWMLWISFILFSFFFFIPPFLLDLPEALSVVDNMA